MVKNFHKDGTAIADLGQVTVPTEIVQAVIALATKGEENEERQTEG